MKEGIPLFKLLFHEAAPGGLEVKAEPSQVVVWVPLIQFHFIVSPTDTETDEGVNTKLDTFMFQVVEYESETKNNSKTVSREIEIKGEFVFIFINK